jgi:hypothetical protein
VGTNPGDVKDFLEAKFDSDSFEYAVLVGDAEFIDVPNWSNVPSDYWYACITGGGWDPDPYPEFSLGRLSVKDTAELAHQVDKILRYHRNPPLDGWMEKSVLAAHVETDPDDYASFKEVIRTDPYNFFTPVCDTVYGRSNGTEELLIKAINQGRNIVNYRGHGRLNYWRAWDMFEDSLHGYELAVLTNGDRTPIVLNLCCFNANLEEEPDCMCEWWMKVDDGAVASWGATRVTYTFEHNVFDEYVYHSFGDSVPGIFRIGDVVYWAHSQTISGGGGHAEYNAKQEILFSDPTVEVGTGIPESLTVAFPGSVPAESTEFLVSVRCDGVPVENILVCLFKDGEVYELALTDALGEATLWPDPSTPGDMFVTFSGHGYLPVEDTCEVLTPQEPLIVYLSHCIDDSQGGNGDGRTGAGETIDMAVWVRNVGSGTSYNAQGVLRISDPYVSLLDSVVIFGDIASSDSVEGVSGLSFDVATECPNGHSVEFTLAVTDDSLHQWDLVFYEDVVTPVLSYLVYGVDDGVGGDGNHEIDPDETVDLDITIKNSGVVDGEGVSGALSTSDPYVDVIVSAADFSLVPAGGTGTSISPYSIYVHSDCPVPHFPELYLDLTGDFGYSSSDTFTLVIGTTGFSSNVDDTSGWTHMNCTGGYDNEWHHSTERYYSSDFSWKCGTVGGNYSDHLDACLETPEFLLGPGSELTFFHWMQAETADNEVDQCYDAGIVEIQVDSGGWEYIEPEGGYPFFIKEGSEHPFPGLLGYSGERDWEQAVFDLSSYSGRAQIRFRFGSDRSVEKEGWYVDDISVLGLVSPDIDLDPWSFSAALDSGDSTSDLLHVLNFGTAPLNFDVQVTEDSARLSRERNVFPDRQTWLSVTPDSGSVQPDSSFDLTVKIDASGLTEGTYFGDIRINSDDPDEPWLIVPVELSVTPGALCGDANGDSSVTTADGYAVLNYFGSGPAPVSCWTANVNGDGNLTTSDGYHLLNHFGSGPDLNCAPCDLSEALIEEDSLE